MDKINVQALVRVLLKTQEDIVETMQGYQTRTAAYKRLDQLYDGIQALCEIIDGD